jgi:hypothetical protein
MKSYSKGSLFYLALEILLIKSPSCAYSMMRLKNKKKITIKMQTPHQ